MTSMCPTDLGEEITNWILNICKPCHIKVKDFVTRIRKSIIYYLYYFLCSTSLEQEGIFALIKKSIPSLERIFHTNNARTTVTTLNQLETYYMDLEEVNPPSNKELGQYLYPNAEKGFLVERIGTPVSQVQSRICRG